jgi:Rhodanese-like domain
MGNTQSIKRISFEDMQLAIKNPELYLIINTLSLQEQHCLILGTLKAETEELTINKYLKENSNIRIIIYGKNSNDENTEKKYKQLVSVGFYNIYIYSGGLFEWLLLQDIYGQDIFPTTKKELDLLKYKPEKMLVTGLLEY